MTSEEWEMLRDWVEKNREHKLNFIEKEAIKAVLRKAGSVEDLLKTALDLLKKQS